MAGEIIHLISKNLDTCFDLVQFRSVCSSWRSSIPPRSCHVSLQCPCPLDKYGYGDDFEVSRSSIFLLRQAQSHNQSPSASWLIKVREDSSGKMFLQNPFFSVNFGALRPDFPRSSFDSMIVQAVLLGHEYTAYSTEWIPEFESLTTAEQNVAYIQLESMKENDFAVLAAFPFRKQAVFRSPEKNWNVFEEAPVEGHHRSISFNGKFYTINFIGKTTVIEPTLKMSVFEHVSARPWVRELVVSDNELLLVDFFQDCLSRPFLYDPPERTICCRVYKLDEKLMKWDPISDLGDRVLFLGSLSSFSSSACEITCVRSNCIFLVDFDAGYCSFDSVLVFDLSDDSVSRLVDCPGYLELFRPPLAWVDSRND